MIVVNLYKDKLWNKINKYVITNYEKLNKKDFKLGELNLNRKCHLNSVQKVKENKCELVYLCIHIENNQPTVHFINKNNDKYIDNTWGWLWKTGDYYLVKEIEESEYDAIGDILESTRQSLLDLFSRKWVRNILLPNDLVI